MQLLLPVNINTKYVQKNDAFTYNSEILKINEINKIRLIDKVCFIDLYAQFFKNELFDSTFTIDGIHLNLECYSIICTHFY